MARKKSRKRHVYLSLLGMLIFALNLPLFLQVGGARWLLAEVLPGQVSFAAVFNMPADAGGVQAVWGVGDVEFRMKPIALARESLGISGEELEAMKDFSYLKNKYYIVDHRTVFLESDIDVEEALRTDFSLDMDSGGPKILIFHTHSHEGFADSDMSLGLQEGIWGVGEELKRILEEDYGVEVLHDDGQYDLVDGQTRITGAYERMEPRIRQILKDNPTIEVCIDMHRDGVAEDKRLVAEVDGKMCAQIMLFDGLCRLNQGGEPKDIGGLENPWIEQNLAFSLQMQTVAHRNFPDFVRKIYLGAYRFSLHMLPRSILVEVGAQTNTKEEAMNAMEPLARMLMTVLLSEE